MEQAEPRSDPPVIGPGNEYDPGPEFKAKVKEVLEELGLLGQTKAGGGPDSQGDDERPKSKLRTLRQEEADSEFLVSKVLDKMKKDAPPAPAKAEKVEVEVSPGPPPKKRKIQSAMWG